jgi:hypothetical protein
MRPNPKTGKRFEHELTTWRLQRSYDGTFRHDWQSATVQNIHTSSPSPRPLIGLKIINERSVPADAGMSHLPEKKRQSPFQRLNP